MTDCPRVLTRDEMIAGLKAGRTLNVDRRDAPELPELLEMEAQGLVESRNSRFFVCCTCAPLTILTPI